jgi:hypothetical protein
VKNVIKSKTEVTAEVDVLLPLGKRKLDTGVVFLSRKKASLPFVKNVIESKTEVTAEVDVFLPLGKRKLDTGLVSSRKYSTVPPQSAPTLSSPFKSNSESSLPADNADTDHFPLDFDGNVDPSVNINDIAFHNQEMASSDWENSNSQLLNDPEEQSVTEVAQELCNNSDPSSDDDNDEVSSEEEYYGGNSVDEIESVTSVDDDNVSSADNMRCDEQDELIEEEDGVDYNLLKQWKDHQKTGLLLLSNNAAYQCQVELLFLLKKHAASMKLYDDIMDWAHKSVLELKHNFKDKPKKRKAVVKSLLKQYDLCSFCPKRNSLILPSSGKKTEVVTHDVRQAIYSLLSDPNLMDDNRLIFSDQDSPFIVPEESPAVITDVHHGSAYYEAYHRLIKNPKREILCPIALYGDKSHITTNGNLTIEPMQMSLLIFNLATRFMPSSWRTIGYLINMSNIPKGATPLDKANDYHASLAVILEQLKEIQESGGIAWQLSFKGKQYDVVFKFPIMFISGDTEGLDKFVGRFQVRTGRVKKLCRYCDCPFLETGNPYWKSKYYHNDDFVQLLKNKDVEGLRKQSHHCLIRNIMNELQFCTVQRGLRAAVPADFLHCVQQGMHIFALEGMFGIQRKSAASQKKKKTKKGEVVATVFVGSADADDRTTNRVFNDNMQHWLDDLIKKYGKFLQHQSDSNLPRLYFPTGICGQQKKAGHEYQGVLMLLLVFFLSKDGERIEAQVGTDLTTAYIHLLELLIMFEEFLKCREFDREEILQVKRWVPAFLLHFKETINRSEGCKFNRIKTHLMLHIADDLLLLGPALGTDSSSGETRHIYSSKRTCQNTQKRSETMHFQSGHRYVEGIAIDRAWDNIEQNKLPSAPPAVDTNKVTAGTHKFSGQTYYVCRDGVFCSASKKKRMPAKWHSSSTLEDVFNVVVESILPHVEMQIIPIYTEFRAVCEIDTFDRLGTTNRSSTQIYRANPCYQDNTWHDWVNVDWEDSGIIPAHLLVFIRLDKVKHPFEVNGTWVESPGYYALAHMIAQPLTSVPKDSEEKNFLAHQASVLFYWARKMQLTVERSRWQTLEKYERSKAFSKPIIGVIDVHAFSSPCIGVPFDAESKDDPHAYLFIKCRETWPQVLMDHINKKKII